METKEDNYNQQIHKTFCIECGAFLRKISEHENKLYLQCTECGLKTEIQHFNTPHILKKKVNISRISTFRKSNDYIHENRFKRTQNIECKNKKCKKKNPEIILITSEYKTNIEYLCSSCKTLW